MTKKKQTILNKCLINMKPIYGMFIFSEDSIYSMNKIDVNH